LGLTETGQYSRPRIVLDFNTNRHQSELAGMEFSELQNRLHQFNSGRGLHSRA
jgi:hypothetical protein